MNQLHAAGNDELPSLKLPLGFVPALVASAPANIPTEYTVAPCLVFIELDLLIASLATLTLKPSKEVGLPSVNMITTRFRFLPSVTGFFSRIFSAISIPKSARVAPLAANELMDAFILLTPVAVFKS